MMKMVNKILVFNKKNFIVNVNLNKNIWIKKKLWYLIFNKFWYLDIGFIKMFCLNLNNRILDEVSM